MPRGVERGAVYRPRGSGGRTGRAGFDEDGFTLAAAALELLDGVSSGMVPLERIHLVGDLPESAIADLPRLVGPSVRFERFGTGPAALAQAVGAALEGSRGAEPVAIVTVDLSDSPSDPDLAVVLRIGPDEGALDAAELRAASDGSSSTAPALRFAAVHGPSRPDRWTGVGRVAEGGASPGPIVRGASPPPDGPVSQGAYVPRPRYLENLAARWRFEGERCGACHAIGFPPRGRCRSCGATAGLVPLLLPREGEVVATTTIGPGGQPTEFDAQVAATGPYEVVLVELAPGIRVTLQVTDAEPGSVRIGDRVGSALRRLYPMDGEWRYGRKARPLG